MSKMHNPPYPGEVFEGAFLSHTKLTISETASRLGVSRKHLTNILKGRARVTADIAKRFEALTGSSAEMWLGIQQDYDLWQLRDVKYDIERVAA